MPVGEQLARLTEGDWGYWQYRCNNLYLWVWFTWGFTQVMSHFIYMVCIYLCTYVVTCFYCELPSIMAIWNGKSISLSTLHLEYKIYHWTANCDYLTNCERCLLTAGNTVTIDMDPFIYIMFVSIYYLLVTDW